MCTDDLTELWGSAVKEEGKQAIIQASEVAIIRMHSVASACSCMRMITCYCLCVSFSPCREELLGYIRNAFYLAGR